MSRTIFKHFRQRLALFGALALLTLISAAIGYAEVAGSFDLSWNTVDGGGGRSNTSAFELTGGIGQPDSTIITSTNVYTLYGGFYWAGPVATPCPACPSPTPMPSPTACAIRFTDVPASNTFYPFVECLACRGVISGYSDPAQCPGGAPCFKPGESVTRGQLAKIASNVSGFDDMWTEQTFTDVPSDSPFYQYIERLYSRSIVSGYSDPAKCATGVPCFLPASQVTRGQISKIVSSAAGLEYADMGQTFEDVPSGSTFYEPIEILAARGVVSGYQCGGAGEPCVPPDNRPYFRPGSSVTRGQTAKIVASTFHPDCVTP